MNTITNDSYELLKYVGGRNNIKMVRHCNSRLRFFLKDMSKIDTANINKLNSVVGSFIQGGQYQVVIGDDVAKYYDEFVDIAGVEHYYKANFQKENPITKIKNSIKEFIFE